ncbi:hypothetical protein, partial [Eubacterium callanderi]|uniref:hypothetical protein n=1 Tax=Eubacterium callanderi TaxID=53442 RepID=UPI00210E4617
MERFEDRYALLKVAYSDMEFPVTRSFLEANGIKVTSREKGFGGPIRSIFMGTFTTANIEIFVDPGDLEEAKNLFSAVFSL